MESTILTYKARPSQGWLWLAALGALVLLLTLGPVFAVGLAGGLVGLLLPLVLGIVIGGMALALAALSPTMRYELRPQALALLFGPWTIYQIPYAEIKKVSWKDLSVSMVSSFRLPGFALWGVTYNDEGVVKMCASACARHILLIRAGNQQYGITPVDEQRFISDLMARVKG